MTTKVKAFSIFILLSTIGALFFSVYQFPHAEEIDTTCNYAFGDVKPDNVFCPYVEYLLMQEVISPNPNYSPDEDITRGAFAKLIVNSFGIPINTSGEAFPDVPADHTFYEFIMTLKDAEIIQGYPDGTYRPDESITRGAAMKFILNAAQYSDADLFDEVTTNIKFPDIPQNHSFSPFIYAVFAATENNDSLTKIIGGYSSGNFEPDTNLTRGQVAKVLANSTKYADIQNISCSEFFCQDKFEPMLTGNYFNNDLYSVFHPGWTLTSDSSIGNQDDLDSTFNSIAPLVQTENHLTLAHPTDEGFIFVTSVEYQTFLETLTNMVENIYLPSIESLEPSETLTQSQIDAMRMTLEEQLITLKSSPSSTDLISIIAEQTTYTDTLLVGEFTESELTIEKQLIDDATFQLILRFNQLLEDGEPVELITRYVANDDTIYIILGALHGDVVSESDVLFVFDNIEL